MPATINGIGTRYLGRRELRIHHGVCERCGREVDLQNYQTRLWFTVVFIPIVPLGKRQVIDYCPRCTSHRSAPLEQWRGLVQQTLNESRQQMSQHPEDPAAVLRHFRTACSLDAREEADALADILKTRFARDADVQLAVGAWYELTGRAGQAEARFAAALAADPDHKAARRAAGSGLLKQGQLARARELLAFAEGPGPDLDVRVLIELAGAYQSHGDHPEALELFAKAVKASPSLARDRRFRKTVRRSQALAPERAPVLAAVPLYRRPGVLVLAAAAVVIAAVPGANYYIATHRTLHVVNGLKVPVTVALDGGRAVKVAPHDRRELTVAEGAHRAAIGYPDAGGETAAFTLAAGWFDRFFSHPAYILNVGGGAIILWEKAHYAERAAESSVDQKLHIGRDLVAFDDVDHIFDDFPSRVSGDEASEWVRTRVSVIAEVEPAGFLIGQWRSLVPDEALRYAQTHLSADPDNTSLLQTFCALAARFKQLGRCRDWLSDRLSSRPVRIEWHRAYQEACKTTGREKMMEQRYRQLLAQEPGSSAVLYLLGRVTGPAAEAMACYDKAIAADPKNAYPWYAKAYHLSSEGDFQAAKAACEKACGLKPDHPQMEELLYGIRLALREHKALEQELRKGLRARPADYGLCPRLMEVLAVGNNLIGARRSQEAFAKALKKAWPGDPHQLALSSRLQLLYFQEDWAALLRESRSLKDAEGVRAMAFCAHLESGQLDRAAQDLSPDDPAGAGAYALLLSIAHARDGNQHAAAAWRSRACQYLSGRGGDTRAAAELLGRAPGVTMKDIRDFATAPGFRAIVLVSLAQACPQGRAEFLALAEKLNYRPAFPHHFLKRAIAAMKVAAERG